MLMQTPKITPTANPRYNIVTSFPAEETSKGAKFKEVHGIRVIFIWFYLFN
jgi:hypothetical protein